MNPILCQIPQLFKDKSEFSTLTVEKDDKGLYSLCVEEKFSTLKLKSTWDCLKEIIGENRLARIAQNPNLGINVSKIYQNTLGLTKPVLRNLFIGLMDIQKDDLDKQTLASIDDQFKQLIVFKNLEEVEGALMGSHLKSLYFDNAETAGKGLEGLIECVYIFMQHHFKVVQEQNLKAAELRDIEMLTSRFADREIRTGSVIHLREGYFYVDKVIVGGGAYLYILLDVSGIQTPKLVCRGTALRSGATDRLKSGLNNVLIEIGTMAITQVWPLLLKYLKEKQISSISLLGKSQGGAHAQELAILIEGLGQIKVEKLITNASVGVGRNISRLFKDEILPRRTLPFALQVIRNGGKPDHQIDYIPALGGVHLGEGTTSEQCNVELCYIQPGDEEVGVYPVKQSAYANFTNFLRTFGLPHRRQTTMQRFNWKKIEAPEAINEHLLVGNKWEMIRLCIAYLVHACSLFRLNRSFSSFFYAQKTKNQ